MKINLRLIPDGGLTIEGEEDPSIIDIDDPLVVFPHPISYHFRVNRVGNLLLIRGTLETEASFICSCCLKKFTQPVRVVKFEREEEIGPDQINIDLTEDIREDIILSIPVKPLCRADCRGICPLCGKELNDGECGCSDQVADSPFAKINLFTGNNQKG